MVILEAISNGLLVAALKLAGPKLILNTKSSILVDPENLSYDQIVEQFCKQILKCYKNNKLYKKKIMNSRNIINNFRMIKKINYIYN